MAAVGPPDHVQQRQDWATHSGHPSGAFSVTPLRQFFKVPVDRLSQIVDLGERSGDEVLAVGAAAHLAPDPVSQRPRVWGSHGHSAAYSDASSAVAPCSTASTQRRWYSHSASWPGVNAAAKCACRCASSRRVSGWTRSRRKCSDGQRIASRLDERHWGAGRDAPVPAARRHMHPAGACGAGGDLCLSRCGACPV